MTMSTHRFIPRLICAPCGWVVGFFRGAATKVSKMPAEKRKRVTFQESESEKKVERGERRERRPSVAEERNGGELFKC